LTSKPAKLIGFGSSDRRLFQCPVRCERLERLAGLDQNHRFAGGGLIQAAAASAAPPSA
jgi:hypothetical protein